ncbi:hypothetical protein GYMLUDRAFT_247527 [Collybiopsis luxurians FD-317 M1]|uniref:Uncharacterized protein n=1 Tax=Collybiopsis luxurians FD-317 M1 TaxID=944289 RepID=A0A0D0BNX7_9AGAR|nr:hypothetical protein GYMLUDRAFT_247527 [Collybiopsis luxurians FD-317 M1]
MPEREACATEPLPVSNSTTYTFILPPLQSLLHAFYFAFVITSDLFDREEFPGHNSVTVITEDTMVPLIFHKTKVINTSHVLLDEIFNSFLKDLETLSTNALETLNSITHFNARLIETMSVSGVSGLSAQEDKALVRQTRKHAGRIHFYRVTIENQLTHKHRSLDAQNSSNRGRPHIGSESGIEESKVLGVLMQWRNRASPLIHTFKVYLQDLLASLVVIEDFYKELEQTGHFVHISRLKNLGFDLTIANDSLVSVVATSMSAQF